MATLCGRGSPGKRRFPRPQAGATDGIVPAPVLGLMAACIAACRPDGIGGVHATKVRAGRARAQQDRTEHIIHNQDGTIGERNSYGNDPASRPG